MSMTPVHISNEKGIVRRAATIPTSSFVGFTAEKMNRVNQHVFLMDWVAGTATSLTVIIEYSVDNTNWFQETFDDELNPAGGVAVTTQSTQGKLRERNYAFTSNTKFFILVPALAPYLRMSIKAAGTLTTSTLAITEIVGVA